MKYKVVKINRGYIMTRELTETTVIKGLPDIKSLRQNDKNKVIAVSEDIHTNEMDSDVYIMRKADCDTLFGYAPRRPLHEITDRFLSAESNSKEEYTGVMLVLRQQIYDYLSGKMTHADFIKVYKDFEDFLGNRGIAKVNGIVDNDFENSKYVNGWMPDDENLDDEYYNVYLESKELSRELDKDGEVIVRVEQWCDESGFVVMFKSI